MILSVKRKQLFKYVVPLLLVLVPLGNILSNLPDISLTNNITIYQFEYQVTVDTCSLCLTSADESRLY